MNNRRKFLRNLSLVSSGMAMSCFGNQTLKNNIQSAAQNDDWTKIKAAFTIDQYPYINLNSGSSGIMPKMVQEATIQYLREMNAMPPYEKWSEWKNLRQQNKTELAEHLQVHSDELSIVRNSTEALSTIIFGLPLEKEDEIIVAEHDYPHVVLAFQQLKKRKGIRIKKLKLDLTTASDDDIAAAYQNALSKRTKLVHLTHITHREGRILPIEKISKAIKTTPNVEILLDAAHSFAQIVFSIPEFGIDYLATSLHKWLNAPHGTGLLYVQADKMNKIYGLYASEPRHHSNTEKFEYQGTRAFHQEMGISAALEFQRAIGWEKKYQRLQQLKHYWTNSLVNQKKIRFGTPLADNQSCAITSIAFSNSPKNPLSLLKAQGIHAKNVTINNQNHIRITPNIFTLEKDLDVLIDAIHQIAKS